MNDDAALLHRYAAKGSQDAFADLVRRHLSLVYHAALRQTGGDTHRAEEVAQRVFTDLARKAAALSHRPLLVAWLHTATRHAAAELLRTELRRQAREHAAFAMNEIELAPEPAADWERLRPLIDDAFKPSANATAPPSFCVFLKTVPTPNSHPPSTSPKTPPASV